MICFTLFNCIELYYLIIIINCINSIELFYLTLFRCLHRYSQIGNAVAVPVGRVLGFALGMAVQKMSEDKPLMALPPKFSHSTTVQLQPLPREI